MPISNKDIAEYYNTHQINYNLFWSKTALHYGFWYDDTKNLAEAVSNTDKFIVDILDINSNDIVFDAGCGVGGTSIYIAETTGAKVEGVTLSDVQIKIAQNRASQLASSNLLNFSKQDFTKTDFKENTFSKVFGIECICHAHKKLDFLNEAYRIMKSGGKIAVVDAFLINENLNDKEKNTYAKFNQGWRLPNLSTREDFENNLKIAGFKNIVFYDKLENIKKSSRILYYYGLITYPLEFFKEKFGVGVPNFAPFCQKKLFEGIATYGVFIAQKL
ncbi:TPA: hypothetical protein DEO28_03270 [Candidatus Dependentiae bacterium]|nr:MAG: SAM-dependent methyltransferase [Parcubacteria group bacterium GW2011_GWF1_39_37]HBZ73504.1 hypothetical protein [Candidatus Dependentiae bacterium]